MVTVGKEERVVLHIFKPDGKLLKKDWVFYTLCPFLQHLTSSFGGRTSLNAAFRFKSRVRRDGKACLVSSTSSFS